MLLVNLNLMFNCYCSPLLLLLLLLLLLDFLDIVINATAIAITAHSEFTVADLPVLVPVHSSDHVVDFTKRYL